MFTTATRAGFLITSLIAASLLTGCGEGTSGTTAAATAEPVGGGHVPATGTQFTAATPSSQAPTGSAAAAPTISGSAATTARIGSAYTFQPAAADTNGDALSFSISNKPAWAAFDAATGKLSGTPASGDMGNFGSITISVSDGALTAALAPFSILVAPGTTGSATLTWTPPTMNTDNSALANLAGYKIYYGTQPDALTEAIQITNPGLTSYTVGNLNAGTYYFAIAAYNSTGVEGEKSTVGSKAM